MAHDLWRMKSFLRHMSADLLIEVDDAFNYQVVCLTLAPGDGSPRKFMACLVKR